MKNNRLTPITASKDSSKSHNIFPVNIYGGLCRSLPQPQLQGLLDSIFISHAPYKLTVFSLDVN